MTFDYDSSVLGGRGKRSCKVWGLWRGFLCCDSGQQPMSKHAGHRAGRIINGSRGKVNPVHSDETFDATGWSLITALQIGFSFDPGHQRAFPCSTGQPLITAASTIPPAKRMSSGPDGHMIKISISDIRTQRPGRLAWRHSGLLRCRRSILPTTVPSNYMLPPHLIEAITSRWGGATSPLTAIVMGETWENYYY